MTTPQPSLPGFRTSIEIDIMSLPILRQWIRRFRSLLMANTAVRREGKLLLYGELAESLRHGMPLNEALGACSQSVRESKKRSKDDLVKGANSRDGFFQGFISMLLLLQAWSFGIILYAIAAFRLADPARIARLLALRLRARVEGGITLSDAMQSLGRDFDREEIEIVRSGERMNKLPEALAKLGKFLHIRKTVGDQGSTAVYPIIFGFVMMVALFVQWKVVPRFEDIFAQMGTELPLFTQRVFQFADFRFFTSIGILAIVCFAGFVFVRGLMNGRLISLHITGVFCFFALVQLLQLMVLRSVKMSGLDLASSNMFDDGAKPLYLVVLLPAILGLPWFMGAVEEQIRSFESLYDAAFAKVPFLGAGAAAEREARWLAAFTLGIESGMASHDALRSAGASVERDFGYISILAAERVESGVALGEACEAAQLPSAKTAAMIAVAERSDSFIERLKVASQDRIEAAEHAVQRCSRLAQVFSVLAAGAIVILLVPAMYLPLFAIPQAVGH